MNIYKKMILTSQNSLLGQTINSDIIINKVLCLSLCQAGVSGFPVPSGGWRSMDTARSGLINQDYEGLGKVPGLEV